MREGTFLSFLDYILSAEFKLKISKLRLKVATGHKKQKVSFGLLHNGDNGVKVCLKSYSESCKFDN